MAIEIVIGNVGSGKTYYATYRIWQEIKKIYEAEMNGYDYKYKKILTNIEGIQENKYVKLLKVDKLIKLYEEELKVYKKWEEEHAHFDFSQIDFNKKDIITDIDNLKQKELIQRYPNHNDPLREYKNINDKILEYIKINNDRELAYIEHTKPIFEKAGFTDALIIIDEAHNYFKTLSAPKERLVSYHRHYDQDYIFITQDLKQLNRKVTGIAQKTIKAVNPVMKASKHFTYKIYSGGYISFRDTNLLEKIKIKADPDIFRLYHSGSSKTQKTYLFKILAKPIGTILLVVLGIIFFIYKLEHKGNNIPSTPKNKVVKINKLEDINNNPHKYTLIKALKIGNFVLYNGKKYYLLDFLDAINKCHALAAGMKKNFDSTITLMYNIRSPECLEKQLSSSSF